jgi:transitional endoplasmic reticulum ATPase
VETFEYAGYHVALVDAAHILAAAAGRRVELLRDGALAPPVREARLSVTRDPREEERQFLLDAEVRTGPSREPKVTVSALGGDPISVLLNKRVAAGDPWAVRIVDGMGAVAAQVSQRLRPSPEPTEPTDSTDAEPLRVEERVDGTTGLRATVVFRGTTDGEEQHVSLRAAVPEPDMSPEMLRGICRLLLDVVTEVAADAPPRALVLTAVLDTDGHATLDQVGGLDGIVGRLRQIAVSFRHPEAMARWGARRPQGLLFYGPPGTGKTMLARALAHEIGARFQEIHTPDILDKWLGASERNIKKIFRDARRYREPTVMLFDEFDSIIGYAGEGGDSASQALNAVAGIFKQEMNDLIEENPRIIVVATTNFPDRVDASLIRSGRFDVKVLVPAPDETGRAEILAKMIRQLIAAHEVGGFEMFADDVDVDALAVASGGMTGADLAEVLRRAQLAKAMQEARTGAPASAIGQADLSRHVTELRGEAVAR